MEFLGWLVIWGALVGALTKVSYSIVPPPAKKSDPVAPWPLAPLAPLPGDRPDAWIDKAIERRATQLVQILPPLPPQNTNTSPPPPNAETLVNTGNTPLEHTSEHSQNTGGNTPPEHRNTPLEHDDFGAAQWESVWRAIESGERSKSAIIRSVWGDVNKSGKPGSLWMQCSEFIAGVIAEYERSGLERIERAYERS